MTYTLDELEYRELVGSKENAVAAARAEANAANGAKFQVAEKALRELCGRVVLHNRSHYADFELQNIKYDINKGMDEILKKFLE